MEKQVRVLVANRPKLMRELIIETLADQPGVEIVGEVSDENEIRERVVQTSPDLLVIALEVPGQRPRVCDMVLREHPELRIIAVASEQNRSVCYWASFDIHSNDIDNSEEGFLSAVRSITAAVSPAS
jgi:DNA-binding NarL/FixJ family response regulator